MNVSPKEAVDIVIQKEVSDLKSGIFTWSIERSGEKLKFNYLNADYLIDVFLNIQNDNTLKKEYLKILTNIIKHSSEHQYSFTNNFFLEETVPFSNSYCVCFYALVKLGFVEEAIEAIRLREFSSCSLIQLLACFQIEDYSSFNTSQLGILSNVLDKIDVPKSNYGDLLNEKRTELIRTMANNRLEILKKWVSGVNVEINQDKKAVVEKIAYLQFDKKYAGLLNEIDNYIYIETSNALNSGIISNLRVFMHDLIIDVADKVAKSKGETIPKTAETPIGNSRQYVKKELMLSDDDHKFIVCIKLRGSILAVADTRFFPVTSMWKYN